MLQRALKVNPEGQEGCTAGVTMQGKSRIALVLHLGLGTSPLSELRPRCAHI